MDLRYGLFAVMAAFFSLPSNPGYADWDQETAYRLAVASNCAYAIQNKNSVKRCFEQHISASGENGKAALAGFKCLPDDAIEIFEASSRRDGDILINAAILVKTGNDVIIAFRGTEKTFEDWKNNVKLIDIKTLLANSFQLGLNEIYKEGRHEGFNNSLKSLTGKIRKSDIWESFIRNPEGKTLYLTGHSKGGALATGATADYDDFKGPVVTYIFEAARFFTADGVNYNKPRLDGIWRFEYQYDIVPHVPLGKVTQEYLLELGSKTGMFAAPVNRFLERIGLSLDTIKNNNINFVPVGQLAYVDSQNQLRINDDRCYGCSAYYRTRFKEALTKNAHETLFDFSRHQMDRNHDPFHFVNEQHSYGYLEFLRNALD